MIDYWRVKHCKELWEAIDRNSNESEPCKSRVFFALVRNGIRTPEKLRQTSVNELYGIRGMGEKGIQVLTDAGLIINDIYNEQIEKTETIKAWLLAEGYCESEDMELLTKDLRKIYKVAPRLFNLLSNMSDGYGMGKTFVLKGGQDESNRME